MPISKCSRQGLLVIDMTAKAKWILLTAWGLPCQTSMAHLTPNPESARRPSRAKHPPTIMHGRMGHQPFSRPGCLLLRHSHMKGLSGVAATVVAPK